MFNIGDKVTRVFNGGITMPLKVTGITPEVVTCGPWDFDAETGYEIDTYLGWDGKKVSGSYLWEIRDAFRE